MIVVGPVYWAKMGNMSSDYVAAICTAESIGGSVKQYCDCDKCKCKMNCCDYAVMITPLAKGPSVNDTIFKRFCKRSQPCLDQWRSFKSLSDPQLQDVASFPCQYNAWKARDGADSTFYCPGDTPCGIVTASEFDDLKSHDAYLFSLKPLWIVLMICGALAILGAMMLCARIVELIVVTLVNQTGQVVQVSSSTVMYPDSTFFLTPLQAGRQDVKTNTIHPMGFLKPVQRSEFRTCSCSLPQIEARGNCDSTGEPSIITCRAGRDQAHSFAKGQHPLVQGGSRRSHN